MSESAGDLKRPDYRIEEETEALAAGTTAVRAASKRLGWVRVEHAILIGLVLLFAAYVIAYFAFDLSFSDLRRWGYIGVFFIALAGAATIILPTPSMVAIFSGGAVLDPVLGIPAPLLVALVAGLGEALGEFSGYALG